MKLFFPAFLLIAGAGLTQASIIESISIDLSALHAGSTLSGTFTLSNTPMVGDTATALLMFSDPSDYSPTSLMATITISSGTVGDAVRFSDLVFTNVNNSNAMTRNIDLTVQGAAQCTSFPCSATGRFEDGSPAVFSSSYTIAPAAAASVPEPGYGPLLSFLLGGFLIGRKILRTA